MSGKKSANPSKPASKKSDGAADVREAFSAMQNSDRVLGERIHEIVCANAPELTPKLWYGMPAYARDGKIVCFFQSAQKFKTRYATFAFMHEARLDNGNIWPTAFAITGLSAADEARLAALVRTAVS